MFLPEWSDTVFVLLNVCYQYDQVNAEHDRNMVQFSPYFLKYQMIGQPRNTIIY